MGYHRKREEKRRLKKTYETIGKYYYPGGVWYDENKDRFIRYYRSGHHAQLPKFALRLANRKVRRKKDHNYKYSEYRKEFDYWWWIT